MDTDLWGCLNLFILGGLVCRFEVSSHSFLQNSRLIGLSNVKKNQCNFDLWRRLGIHGGVSDKRDDWSIPGIRRGLPIVIFWDECIDLLFKGILSTVHHHSIFWLPAKGVTGKGVTRFCWETKGVTTRNLARGRVWQRRVWQGRDPKRRVWQKCSHTKGVKRYYVHHDPFLLARKCGTNHSEEKANEPLESNISGIQCPCFLSSISIRSFFPMDCARRSINYLEICDLNGFVLARVHSFHFWPWPFLAFDVVWRESFRQKMSDLLFSMCYQPRKSKVWNLIQRPCSKFNRSLQTRAVLDCKNIYSLQSFWGGFYCFIFAFISFSFYHLSTFYVWYLLPENHSHHISTWKSKAFSAVPVRSEIFEIWYASLLSFPFVSLANSALTFSHLLGFVRSKNQ